MQQASPSIRNNWYRELLATALVCLALAITGVTATAQPEPDPQPTGIVPYFYDPEGVFDEAQQATLMRDAQLVQSSNIPTIVYVRTATVEEATPDIAKAFATDVRESWSVETAADADDGMVVVYSHVPDNPGASTIVGSWGTATFDGSGLSPGYVERVLAENPRMLLDDGHPFEAIVYALREIRYGGIYFPPPPAPVDGVRNLAHTAANIVGPILVIAVATGLVLVSIRDLAQNVTSRPFSWGLGGSAAAVLGMIAALSIYGQSRLGIACTAILAVTTALQVWVWTRPSRSHRAHFHRRSVPPTTQRMRKRAQMRRLRPPAEVQA